MQRGIKLTYPCCLVVSLYSRKWVAASVECAHHTVNAAACRRIQVRPFVIYVSDDISGGGAALGPVIHTHLRLLYPSQFLQCDPYFLRRVTQHHWKCSIQDGAQGGGDDICVWMKMNPLHIEILYTWLHKHCHSTVPILGWITELGLLENYTANDFI